MLTRAPPEATLLADLAPAMAERGFALRRGYAQFRKVVSETIVATIQPRYAADTVLFRPVVGLTETRHERLRMELTATARKPVETGRRARWDRPTVVAWHPQSIGPAELRDAFGRTHPFWVRALGWAAVRENLLRWVDGSALPWVRRYGNLDAIVDLLARAAAARRERGVADADDLLIGLYLAGRVDEARALAREYRRYASDPPGAIVPSLDDGGPDEETARATRRPKSTSRRAPRRPGHLIDLDLLLGRLAQRFDSGLLDAL